GVRLAAGLALALLAVRVFTAVRSGSAPFAAVLARVYHPGNVSLLVQVFLGDLTIAALFVRLGAALGEWPSLGLVAALFAAGHVPALLADGVATSELASLALDAGLGLLVLGTLRRSADLWWFWCVHYALDMMQYYAAA